MVVEGQNKVATGMDAAGTAARASSSAARMVKAVGELEHLRSFLKVVTAAAPLVAVDIASDEAADRSADHR